MAGMVRGLVKGAARGMALRAAMRSPVGLALLAAGAGWMAMKKVRGGATSRRMSEAETHRLVARRGRYWRGE